MQNKLWRGFTLLEVLVALSIIAIALAAVIHSVSLNASQALYLENKTFANWIAMDLLTEIRLQGKLPAENSGQINMAQRTWQWKIALFDTVESKIKRLEITITLAQQDTHLINLIAFMYLPELLDL